MVTTRFGIKRGPRRDGGVRIHMRSRQLALVLWVCLDMALMLGAMALTAVIINRSIPTHCIPALGIIMLARIATFQALGMYRLALRYSGMHMLSMMILGVGVGTAIGMAAGALAFMSLPVIAEVGREFLVLESLLTLMACGGARSSGRLLIEWRTGGNGERVLIYGAGSLGELVLRDLKRLGGYRAIGFLDDEPSLKGMLINGKPVLGGLDDFARICAAKNPSLVVIAISKLQSDVARRVFQAAMEHKVRTLVVNGVTSALDHHARLDLRDLALEDLLSRPSRALDPAPVSEMLAGKSVMVTGAGGSIGTELCHQIARMGAAKLIVVDQAEHGLYTIEGALRETYPGLAVVAVLSNLRSRTTLGAVLAMHRPQVVLHAAAYKHVPMVEGNPFLGMSNNVAGFMNVMEAADAAGVERLVLVSTDKAVRPTNVMGASKRVCELLLQNFPAKRTKMCAVRFGNVLGSSGSVVPRFLQQIAAGGPVTVTHPDITRYFMLIPEAVALVLRAGTMAEHGEIFILDMGEPVRIQDMARQLIIMSGHRPDDEIKISFTGLRPGEKLYEELIMGDTERGTDVNGITVARATAVPYEQLNQRIAQLLNACDLCDLAGFTLTLRSLVPEWAPSKEYEGAPRVEATEARASAIGLGA